MRSGTSSATASGSSSPPSSGPRARGPAASCSRRTCSTKGGAPYDVRYAPIAGADGAFTVDASRITFGRGCLAELGPRAAAHGLRRVALFTDPRLRALPAFAAALASLEGAGLDVVVYAEVEVEPTDRSFKAAARFAAVAGIDPRPQAPSHT